MRGLGDALSRRVLPWPAPPSCRARLPVGPWRAFFDDAAEFTSGCGLAGCTLLREGSTPRFDARISPYVGGLLRSYFGLSGAPPPQLPDALLAWIGQQEAALH